jgi:hypothetical protein
MDPRLARLTTAMLVERIAVGALVALTPRVALRLFGLPPEADGPALRYVGRLFGIRNAVLGLVVWHARDEPERLARVAALNAATEAMDAVAAAVPLVRRQGIDRAAGSALVVSLTVMAGFLRLRTAARSG